MNGTVLLDVGEYGIFGPVRVVSLTFDVCKMGSGQQQQQQQHTRTGTENWTKQLSLFTNRYPGDAMGYATLARML